MFLCRIAFYINIFFFYTKEHWYRVWFSRLEIKLFLRIFNRVYLFFFIKNHGHVMTMGPVKRPVNNAIRTVSKASWKSCGNVALISFIAMDSSRNVQFTIEMPSLITGEKKTRFRSENIVRFPNYIEVKSLF